MYNSRYYQKRMTRQEMRDQLQSINELLVKAGIDKQFSITHRYDYYGLDVYRTSSKHGSMESGPHRIGTFRQCLDHAYLMALSWIAEEHFDAS
jgi:hypothetical protein